MERVEARSILIDANLLALLAVGGTSLELVAKHKKTKAFTVDDYAFLLRHIGRKPMLVIPNIATETSNLVACHRDPERSEALANLRRLLGSFREQWSSVQPQRNNQNSSSSA